MADIGLSGGEALEAKLREIADRLGGKGSVRIGFLEGATYPDGTPVALIAATNEFGRPENNQPPRPFFRTMIAEKSPQWGRAIGRIAEQQNYDVDRTLELMGQGIAAQLRAAITDFDSVPLAPATIARKGFDKQLIDTAVMIRAVDYEVVDTSGAPAR